MLIMFLINYYLTNDLSISVQNVQLVFDNFGRICLLNFRNISRTETDNYILDADVFDFNLLRNGNY